MNMITTLNFISDFLIEHAYLIIVPKKDSRLTSLLLDPAISFSFAISLGLSVRTFSASASLTTAMKSFLSISVFKGRE